MCSVECCERPVRVAALCSMHYQRVRKYGDPHFTQKPRDRTCTRPGCERKHASLGLCVLHYTRQYRHGEVGGPDSTRRPRPDRTVSPRDGYVRVRLPGHSRADKSGMVLEHLVVMERQIGRPLDWTVGEQVHHINGVKSDNRPENLELWVTSQPRGQRPDDLLAWAKEIIARYGG